MAYQHTCRSSDNQKLKEVATEAYEWKYAAQKAVKQQTQDYKLKSIPHGSWTSNISLLGESWFIVTLRAPTSRNKTKNALAALLVWRRNMKVWLIMVFEWTLKTKKKKKKLCLPFYEFRRDPLWSNTGHHHLNFNKDLIKHVQSLMHLSRHHTEARDIIFVCFITRIKTINRVSCDIMLTKYSVHKH